MAIKDQVAKILSGYHQEIFKPTRPLKVKVRTFKRIFPGPLSLALLLNSEMAEKLCLQWNDFQENVKSAFGHLRGTNDFSDVTVACEDGQQIEAHKAILAALSPFFQRILKRNQHSHPLIYMKGMKSDDLIAIVDFLYFGEANVFQENLDNFLAIAEELQLKGLEGSKDHPESNEAEQVEPNEKYNTDSKLPTPKTQQTMKATTYDSYKTGSNTLVLPKTSVMSADLQQLDETVKGMMDTSENLIQVGKNKQRAKICKVCGKEGHGTDIMRHIESCHLEGVSIPCNLCDKILRSRHALRLHIKRNHTQN